MEQSKGESNSLSEVQKAIASKAGNPTFLKKVNLEKGGKKYMAISMNRIFFLAIKSPYKIEASAHLLEIHSLESTKASVLRIKTTHEKSLSYKLTTDDEDDVQFIVAQIIALLRHNFPGSKRSEQLTLKIEPVERLENMKKLAGALASPSSDSENGPCGGFSLSYSSVCDIHGVKPMAEVIWDVDKIYGSHGCKNFNISDFDHLEVKELVPLLATFEYNNWFHGFSCRSYKLSNELVDALVKVFKSNTSIEDLDLYECRLTKENIQKLSQAIASNSKTGLKRINFGKNSIDDRGAPSFCNVLSSLPHGLESLLLKDVSITGKGASLIFTALKGNQHISSSLTCLNLSSNPLKADGAAAVCDYLANANILQELNLSKTECSLELVFGALVRGCLQYLKVLNLSGNPYSYRRSKEAQIAPSVTMFFTSSMALETVNLSNTKVSAEFTKAVLIGLIANTMVKDVSLHLAGNELRSAGAAEISSCIGSVVNVSSLDLSDNGLDADIVGICHSIQKNKSLKHLNLSQNIGKSRSINVPAILESIVEMIITDALPLKSLSIADNRLRQDAYVIIDSLGTNGILEELDISGNLIGDEGVRLLAKALQINTKLKKIILDRNGTTLKGFHSLAVSMERNYSLQLIPVPFGDLLPLMKSNGDAVSKCFAKIDELLLRNQSIELTEKDHSVKLKQNLLLNSLDQESTDVLLVKVQDAIAELKGCEGDETVAKEVSVGKEAIKDADKMKEVLFKLFVDLGNPSKKIEERADKMLKEVTDFANELVKQNVNGTLTYLKEQCTTIAANDESMKYLESLISTKGEVDSIGLRETITRTMVGLVSNKVSDATLHVASAFAEHLTKMMQDTLKDAKVKLDLLAMEYKDKQKNEKDVKKGDSLPTTPVDEKDEISLAAQKAKNRMSTHLLSEDGTVKGKGIGRRPTFRREKQFEEVAMDISIDEVPAVEENKVEKEIVEKVETGEKGEKDAGSKDEEEKKVDTKEKKEGKKEEKKEEEKEEKKEEKKDEVLEKEVKDENNDKRKSKEVEKEELKKEDEKVKTEEPEKIKTEQPKDVKMKQPKEEKAKEPTDITDKGEKVAPPIAEPRRGSYEKLHRPKQDLNNVRAASVSVKEPKKPLDVEKKPRPLSDLSFLDKEKSQELIHLNKGRAKPQNRRPPSKAVFLAHLATDEIEINVEEVPKEEKKEKKAMIPVKKEEQKPLKTSPKPRPKSMQPLDSPTADKEMGVIRTGSIPHKSSESLKAKLNSEGEKPEINPSEKPEIKKPPAKPEPPKKEDSIKKPKLPLGLPLPGLPNILSKPNILKKGRSPSVNKDEETEGNHKETSEERLENGEQKESKTESETKEHPEPEQEKTPEVAEKPKAKKYKPPGAVPMMGFGGALMAEMKKKRGIKEKEPEPEEKAEEKPAAVVSPPTAAKPTPTATKPTPTARKPPPPAKLSAEKRRSLILDAGAKPVILDKPDGPAIAEIKDIDTAAEHEAPESKGSPKIARSRGSTKSNSDSDEKSSDKKAVIKEESDAKAVTSTAETSTESKTSEENNNTESTENEA